MEKSKAVKRDSITTAKILSDALPHMQRHDGSIIVIKLGGHAMSSPEAMASFARDVVLMRQCNVNPVIVHGGGPMINEMLKKLDIPSEFVNGKRVSDAATVEVVEMVLSGKVNKSIVQAINGQGGRAVGISGKDANLMVCTQAEGGLGLVGDPQTVDARVVRSLINDGMIPVIAPLGAGAGGETFNVNGDTAAGAIAAGLKADRLLLLTDVEGVKDADGDVITSLSAEHVEKLTREGVIAGGMIPKTQTALDAVRGGVKAVVIMNGQQENACLLELFTTYGAGSMIRA
ncbi:MAG: acetylglutamate kinase [Rhodobacteraceae bacterium]|nr:acetylglutamate kinase [Paracoccaceae bacterium]